MGFFFLGSPPGMVNDPPPYQDANFPFGPTKDNTNHSWVGAQMVDARWQGNSHMRAPTTLYTTDHPSLKS